MERTFYKLLWLALLTFALGVVLGTARDISVLLAQGRSGFRDPIETATAVIFQCGRMLMPIVALYWIPKIIRHLFPEVR